MLDPVLSARTLTGAATSLCTQLSAAVGARRVALGWCKGDACRVIGLSDSAVPTLPAGDARALERVMFEAIDQALLVDSSARGAEAPITQMARALTRKHPSARIITIPLGRDGHPHGALTVIWSTDKQCPEQAHALLIGVGHFVVDLLALIERDAQPFWRRLLVDRPVAASNNAHRLRRSRRALIVSIVTLSSLALAVPFAHSISAEARVEGEIQRVVAAPVDGYLKEVLARPGDHITAGQTLARLGERDLELERQRSQSELTQRQSEKTVALARADRAGMMIAQARIDEVKAKLDLANEQLQRMTLDAPIDGVLIDGDQARAVGAPVERGQTLFTLAPADRYRIVVELDERDIHDVRTGQTGSLALSALPWDTVALTVTRIGAAARIVDGRNVFEIEAEPATSVALRPGLRGVARLDAAAASLGQRLVRRMMLTTRRLWWRWLP